MKNENTNKIVTLILRGIPLAMSVAVIALSVLKQISPEAGVVMLAIGMFSAAVERMRQ